ncbi:hypothetical protein HDF26_002907 [Pedobacter cryoconitis]|uniref:Cytochrome c551/c552 n=1 Tax=Pedobacter cryoconitis TaxID=188932 RepID=A0A7W8ZIF4_9SPHI|nr:heme-binding domain-containing protein [Pedobacter cryoconitis]MBB5634425.1 cytochrome c551/c552 [Pedobacter cryoconitis]MBB6272450.1 hypothetical protein [Pedobacter cryoconitis]
MKLSELTKSKKILTCIVIGLFVGVSIQFTTKSVSNPAVTGSFQATPEVESILKRACYDCHSNETNLAWFDQIAPVSWQISHDVNEARSRFNFSEWDKLSKTDQEAQLWEIVNMIDQGKMPLKKYTILHPSAKVTKDELQTLKNYVLTLSGAKKVDITVIIKASHQVVQTPQTNDNPDQVPVALNGISYSDEYKSWKVIANTNRFDNGTMRIIYGNDIAVKAIADGHINPFPNGAKIAKVVWNKQAADKDGNVKPGNFNNIQYMIKDDKKFRATEGWGFARFTSLKLLPFGKNIAYGTACINCHRLVKHTGFVFDIPSKRENKS